MRLVARTKRGQNTEGSVRNSCGSAAHTNSHAHMGLHTIKHTHTHTHTHTQAEGKVYNNNLLYVKFTYFHLEDNPSARSICTHTYISICTHTYIHL
jgi:hypothetical protein